MKMWLTVFVLIFAIGLLATGSPHVICSPDVICEQHQGRVIFLEHSMVANGTVQSGEVPFRSVNFPSYWFNENTSQLNGAADFPLNGSLEMIFGDSLTLKGNFGGGTGNKLFGVYGIPVKADQATVFWLDPSGTVGLYVNNQTSFIRPGQDFSYNESETLRDGNGIVNLTYEHTYANRGFIDPCTLKSDVA